jgi:hypothetical protein
MKQFSRKGKRHLPGRPAASASSFERRTCASASACSLLARAHGCARAGCRLLAAGF